MAMTRAMLLACVATLLPLIAPASARTLVQTSTFPAVAGYTLFLGQDSPGHDISFNDVTTVQDCASICNANAACVAFDYIASGVSLTSPGTKPLCIPKYALSSLQSFAGSGNDGSLYQKSTATNSTIKPRMADSLITDKGYPNVARGWYDAQCQGAANDYCRYVGDQPPNAVWSCALAGGTNQYATWNNPTFANTKTVCTSAPPPPPPPTIKPRMADSLITDKGYSWVARGWYDAQCQGAPNDYCRYVGNQPPNAVWSCALAGGTNQYATWNSPTYANTQVTCSTGKK